MAIAGLHNVSVFDSSFLLESRSPVSRRWGEEDRPSTRASALLKMWRELEGEHVVSHPNVRFGESLRMLGTETSDSDRVSTQGSVNGNDSLENSITVEFDNGLCSQSLIESENEDQDDDSFCSEQSTDLGEFERERVRQIFRVWMKSGVKSHSPNASHRNNRTRAQWLGENECERVRIIRERVQMNAQQGGTCGSPRDVRVAEFGSQIGQVRDGLLVNRCEVAERRPIRKLCGRQALLDMLMRAQRERKKDLQDLLERRPVSDFAHRNRIQSLLKGRFLLNQRLIQDERPASTAASELGLVRRRQTVSDLREGFLSRSDRSSVNGVQNTSSNDEHDNHRNEQSQSSNEQEVQDEIYNQSEPGNAQRETKEIDTVGNILHNAVEDVTQQEYDASVTEAQRQVLEDEEREHETSSIELINSGHGREDDATGSWRNNPDEWWQRISDTEGTLQTHLLDGREMHNENEVQSIDGNDVHEADSHMYGSEGSMTEEFAWHGMPAQVEEWQESETEHEESDLRQFPSGGFREWTEVNGEGIGGSWQEGIANEWYLETSGNDVGGHNHLQESDGESHENVQQEAIDSWSDVPSGLEANSVGRIGSLYFPDEDNIRSVELRQLLNRRHVSTLLHSGFRESLNQLIQSYVQRQNNASVDWELDETSPFPSSIDHNQEQQHSNQAGAQIPWNQELQDANWPDHTPRQRVGHEWEVINELRIDMARLHQRMNNMQRMLEACMDMQFELQRSVRQEVSAALNRSVIAADACKDHLPMDDTKWDHVRKGICCMCSEKNIDSLLYRCGHMCTCSKCAEKLVQGGKCPMCWAPVTEVIRAYFIQ